MHQYVRRQNINTSETTGRRNMFIKEALFVSLPPSNIICICMLYLKSKKMTITYNQKKTQYSNPNMEYLGCWSCRDTVNYEIIPKSNLLRTGMK